MTLVIMKAYVQVQFVYHLCSLIDQEVFLMVTHLADEQLQYVLCKPDLERHPGTIASSPFSHADSYVLLPVFKSFIKNLAVPSSFNLGSLDGHL